MRDLRRYRVRRAKAGVRGDKLLGALIVALGVCALGVFSFASHQTFEPLQSNGVFRSAIAPNVPQSSVAIRTTPDAGQPQQVPPPVEQPR